MLKSLCFFFFGWINNSAPQNRPPTPMSTPTWKRDAKALVASIEAQHPSVEARIKKNGRRVYVECNNSFITDVVYDQYKDDRRDAIVTHTRQPIIIFHCD